MSSHHRKGLSHIVDGLFTIYRFTFYAHDDQSSKSSKYWQQQCGRKRSTSLRDKHGHGCCGLFLEMLSPRPTERKGTIHNALDSFPVTWLHCKKRGWSNHPTELWDDRILGLHHTRSHVLVGACCGSFLEKAWAKLRKGLIWRWIGPSKPFTRAYSCQSVR